MGDLSLFETIAQIAAALVGFSGIVLALKNKVASDMSAIERARLSDLFIAGFGTLFFSFVPVLL